MTKRVLFAGVSIITIAMLILGLWLSLFPSKLPDVSTSSGLTAEQVDEQKINELLAAGYQVDVYVNSNHMTDHAESPDALRCINNRGNVAAFSEKWSRKLHLLCWDDKTQTLFDIIITRIRYEVERFHNPDSHLVTAYSPEGVQGVNLSEKLDWYLEHLRTTIGGKPVGLHFNPGEIMFIPK